MKSISTFLIFVFYGFSLLAEEGIIYYNRLYYENKDYILADLEGQGVTWDWDNRNLRFSNSFGTPNDKFEYPKSDDWIIIGPFDLSMATDPVFSFLHKLDYGTNSLSVHASSNFPGHIPGSTQLAGTWIEVQSKDEVNSVPGMSSLSQVNLSEMVGNPSVYIGIRYLSPNTAEVSTSTIQEMKLTRMVSGEVTEILPAPDLNRSAEGKDFFNLSGIPGSTALWSIRTGYARASGGNDMWLVFRSFDLTSSGDAFFSIASQLLNGSNGPIGLQIKITRSEFKTGDLIDQFEWEDYSNFGIDHRVNATGYWESGKMDLSAYLGGYVTVAFRYINAVGEQYQIRDFKMFHVPDKVPPVFQNFSIEQVAHHKLELRINANERASFFWGIYPAEYAGTPNGDELEAGTGADIFGSQDYLSPFIDSLYQLGGFEAERHYKLFGMLKDRSDNRSLISVIEFTSPSVDSTPPAVGNFEFSEVLNNSLKADISFSERNRFYYLLRPSILGAVDREFLRLNGKSAAFMADPIRLSFVNLEKSTEYSLFIVAEDFVGNSSEVVEYRVTTSNIDRDPPDFNFFRITSVSNQLMEVQTSINEVCQLFYAVQYSNEVPPSAEGIMDGGRAVVSGKEVYSVEGGDFTFSVSGLKAGRQYVIYCFASDENDNQSIIQSLEFKTTTFQIPVISHRSDQRIVIGREGTLTINEEHYVVSNYDHPEELDLLIYTGDNYLVQGNSITAVDEFTGAITVPIALGKDTTRYSNVITLDVIVDLQTVADSLIAVRRMMLDNTTLVALPDKSTPVALLELRSDGSFFDAISSKSPDYTDYMTTVLGGRLINIANDYYNDKFRRRKKIQIRHQLYLALEYWLDHKPDYRIPEAPFQWPQYLGAILLILHDDMVEEYKDAPEYREQIDRLRNKADAFNLWCWNGVPEVPFFQPFEGNNLTRRLWGSFAIAAALEQPQTAFMIRDTLHHKLELQYNGNERMPAGLSPDGSFTMNNQSGAQWNWNTYGASYINQIIEYAAFTRRTPWRLSPGKFQLLGDALTQGVAWFFWRDFIPYNLLSKYSTRNGRTTSKSTYLNLMNRIRYESFVNNYLLDNNQKITGLYKRLSTEYSSVDSTKYFWNSNIMVHSRPLYYSSLVMPSKRTGNLEADADTLSGLRNFFMGDGVLLTMVNENSYYQRNVFNYRKLPGTTASLRDVELPVNYGGMYGKSLNEFAGGVSNGRNGVSSFYYDKENNIGNVVGQKSYFFFNQAVVALGTGFKKKTINKQNTVYTIIEQDLLSSELKHKIASDQYTSIDKGTTSFSRSFTLSQPALVYTGGKGYVVLPQSGGDRLNITIQEQTGAWDEINGTWRNHLSNPNYVMPFYTAPVLTMEIDHGKEPSGAKYGYIIFPGQSEKNFLTFTENMPIRVIANNDTVQAVSDNNKVFGIVFMKPGMVKLSNRISVNVDKPAILLVEEKEDGGLEAYVSDPYQRETLVNLFFTITNPNENPYYIQRIVSFPQGVLKGKAAFTSTGDVWAVIPPLPEEKRVQYYLPHDQLTSNQPVELNTSNSDFKFTVYPVPVNSGRSLNVRYSVSQRESLSVRVISLSGQVVYSRELVVGPGNYEDQIVCELWSPGVYMMHIRAGERVGTKKIIIN